jgi:hypothetical protein
MNEINRVKRKQGKLSDKPFFKKGNLRQCRECGFFYGEGTNKIAKTDRGWICTVCVDPDK